ncbi:MAG: hypothetical protein QOG01_173 [Pseudonocardiales bacterium]|nr:hypothetical protein [Pseudonocardiales bacterium]
MTDVSMLLMRHRIDLASWAVSWAVSVAALRGDATGGEALT